MQQHDADNDTVEIPCRSCGSYQDECRCTALHEQLVALRESGLSILREMQRIDYDTAMVMRALREYGYTR